MPNTTDANLPDPAPSKATLEDIVSLCKRRGFVFQSSDIYGGVSSVWDYGPLGAELKRNVRNAWWKVFVQERSDVVGIETAILMHPRVWEISGHLQHFSDPLVDCASCRRRFRADDIKTDSGCPNCGGTLSDQRNFNLLFKTFIGPVQESSSEIYLRPETAQGIFVNFDNVRTTSRKRIPFGIAQIGKSFRNEITHGNFIFRMREFEQMEMEFFCHPNSDLEWFRYWVEFSNQWFRRFGIKPKSIRNRHHTQEELPHYASESVDLEYAFPWGWGELETVSNRTDYDLQAHAQASGKDFSYFDDAAKERFVPYIVEPAMGVDRSTLAFLCQAYDSDSIGKDTRVVLRFHPDIAPVQVAILPLSRNDRLKPTAERIYNNLNPNYLCGYDDAQSIGRRYRRQDEIGTPLCITVDFDTVDTDSAVTIRDRDTMNQLRVSLDRLTSAVDDELQRMRKEASK